MKCPYCSRDAYWVSNEKVYGRRLGKSYMIWVCFKCDAYVGCAHNSRKALGTIANKELRTWRRNAHQAIDPLWKNKQYSRGEVYNRLKQAFGFVVHIGESDLKTCKDIVKTVPLIFDMEGGQKKLL